MANEVETKSTETTAPANAIPKGTLFKVHTKHGSWWSEMTRGAVLEVKEDGVFGAPIRLGHYGWAQGDMMLTPVAEVTKKGVKIQLVAQGDRFRQKNGKPRALTVLAYSHEEMQADRERKFGRGASSYFDRAVRR